jgi:hypothetical protein
MKTCPHCAEDILDAARVCKHCHRTLVPPPYGRWVGGVLFTIALFLGVSWVAFYNSDEEQQHRAFVAQREAWHRDCWPVDPPPLTPAGRVCADELARLQAAARRHGWDPTTIAR